MVSIGRRRQRNSPRWAQYPQSYIERGARDEPRGACPRQDCGKLDRHLDRRPNPLLHSFRTGLAAERVATGIVWQ